VPRLESRRPIEVSIADCPIDNCAVARHIAMHSIKWRAVRFDDLPLDHADRMIDDRLIKW
jgi:hypothetical protein